MNATYLQALCRENHPSNPLFAFLNAEIVPSEAGEAVITLPVTTCLRQDGGLIAGGILATLVDSAMANAVLSMLRPDQDTVTAEMNVRFLRSADPDKGGKLTARAKVIKSGQTLWVTEASVHEGDRLLVTAGATFYILAKRDHTAEND